MSNVPTKALSVVADSLWKTNYLRKSREAAIQWLPLTRLAGKSYAEGVTRDGRWVVETADGLLEIDDSQFPAVVLPMMERSFDDVIADLRTAFSNIGLSDDLGLSFPINSVIACGLSTSSYWAELAINWIERLSCDSRLADTVIPLLKTLIQDKNRQPQRTRHRARRILNVLDGHRG